MKSGKNAGDSWCICMWATAELIKKVGCKNVHIDCAATDVQYVLSKYNDGGIPLSSAHDCLINKCFSKKRNSTATLLESAVKFG